MNSTKSALNRIPIIKSVSQIELTPQIKEIILSSTQGNEASVQRAMHKHEVLDFFKIKYFSNEHTVTGFIVQPKNIVSKTPVVIYNRGGNSDIGMITPSLLFGDIANLSKQGYIVIASQYSGVDGGEGRDEMGGVDVNDVLVLKSIIDSYDLADNSRIGMIGYSRGGMMTYIALSKVNWVNAAVVIGAPTNLLRAEELRPEMKKVHATRFGGGKIELEKRSALFWADKLSLQTHLLIMHGAEDERVSIQDAQELAEALGRNKNNYQLKIYPGASHGLAQVNKEYHQDLYKWFAEWL